MTTTDTAGSAPARPGPRPVAAHPRFAPRPVRRLTAWLATARPRQWVKNALVLAAPAAAGVLTQPAVALAASRAALTFTLASVGTYYLNDALDAEADRRHPVKCRRPVAAGVLRPRRVALVGAVVALCAVLAAVPLGGRFTAVLAGYLLLTACYSLWFKHVPVLDILAVAAGFVLRALAGAFVSGVPLSNWFLLVSLFGSLFLVTAKRTAERGARGDDASGARAVLAGCPREWLQQVMTMSLSGTVVAYASWAFQYVGQDVALPLLSLSIVPFLAALLRFSLLVAQGSGEAPERLLLSDRFLLGCGMGWAVLVGTGIYLV